MEADGRVGELENRRAGAMRRSGVHKAPIASLFIPKPGFNVPVEVDEKTEQDAPRALTQLLGDARPELVGDPFEVSLPKK